ncbi:hypothetical protein TNCV_423941 [Trichonephila clavipes]|nr:hypothetical protein TNCV_423941 [Trichonephila clavipes]
MSARYHFRDYDKGRSVGRSAASQRASTVAAATDLNPIEHAWDALVRRIAQKPSLSVQSKSTKLPLERSGKISPKDPLIV